MKRKYKVPETKIVEKPVITPNGNNPKYFELHYEEKEVPLTPAEKNWISFQIREQERERQKAKQKVKQAKRVTPDDVFKILIILLIVVYALTQMFPDFFQV